ncbi:MAG: hypothetical protein ACRENZ_07080, partial [Thermodesulfobacteriota bacterium]
IEAACGLVGISKPTFFNWMNKGEKGQGQNCIDFFNRMKKAQSQVETRLIIQIEQDPSWQAKMTILERKWPERWGRRERLIHEGGDKEKPIRYVYEEIITDERPKDMEE